MKIAFLITSTGWGGLEMNTLKLARLLKERGYSITLLSQENSTIYHKGKSLFSSVVLLNKSRKYFDFKMALAIGNSLKKEDTKTLMVFDNKDLDVAAWTKKIFFNPLKIIYQQHMQIGINKKDFLHTFRFNAIDCWISPLQYLKNEILNRTRFPAERVKIIPLCTDTKKFTQKKYSKEEALNALNISPKAPLIGIIGRISEKKGQLFLVESLAKLREEGIQIELLIFGSATVNDPECQNYYHRILEAIKKKGLEKFIHLVEYREDAALFYNAVDVFVLASHSETYGMVTIEAMLSQLPIIATQSGGTSEILENGELGLLYKYNDYQSFSQQITWLLNNKTNASEMASTAQRVAKDKYEQEIETAAIDNLIRNLSAN